LSDQQMRRPVGISSWYVNATKAEGCCLPLLEAMASSRPWIGPDHTAMKDYVRGRSGVVGRCSAEPCAFSGDPSGRPETSWQRICWASLSEQLVRAYEIRKFQPEQYEALAWAAREAARVWASEESVRRRRQALARL
jgi:hypothetical protein